MPLNFLNNGYFAGTVGIGTDNPNAPLEIFQGGSGKVTLLQLARPNTAGLQSNIQFTVADIMVGQIQHEYEASNLNHMSFTLRAVNGLDITPLWLQNSGNVGIGTDDPVKKLNVEVANGDGIRISNSTNSAYYSDLLLNYNDVSTMQLTCMGTSILQAGNTGNTVLESRTDKDIIINPNGTGNVGINNTAPHFDLQITGGNATEETVLKLDKGTRSDTGGHTTILGFGTETGAWAKSGIGFERTGSYDIGDMHFLMYPPGSNTGSVSLSDTVMTIKNNGNVGIGTASPVGNLFVGPTWSQTGGNDLYIKNQVTTTSYDPSVNNTQDLGVTYNTSSTTTTGPDKTGLVLHNDAGVAGQFSPMIIFSGREATPSQFKAAMAGIYARSPLGTGNSNDYIDGELIFATAGAATKGIVQRMVINKEGNVGIGVFSPTEKLHLQSTTSGCFVRFADNTASGVYVGARANELEIYAGNAERFGIDANGVVRFNAYGTGILQTDTNGVISATLSPLVDDIIFNNGASITNQINTDVDTGTETVASVAIATYTAAFFDFVIKKTTNVRSGTVYACHDGTNVQFTETSTQDLGDTSDVTLSVDISGGNMRLRATTTSDDWSIKSLIRAI